MERIYVFLIRNDIWIYILCGLGLFWYGSELLRARRILRQAMFNLERERGRRARNSALFFVVVLLAIAGSVAYVNTEIAPTLPADLLRAPTPTLDPFHLPLSSPTPVRSTPRPVNTPTPPLVPTVTLPEDALQALATVASNPVATRPSDTNDGTPAPPDTTAATPEPVANCPENVNLSAPNAGSAISGLVPFSGTATAANFSFYKLEINGPQTDNTWASLLGRTISQPVFAGLLGSGNFNGWLPGAYRVRLIVVDATGNEQGSCTVDININ